MSEEPFLPAKETDTDYCPIGSSKLTEHETNKEENDLEASKKCKKQNCDKSGNTLKVSSSLFSKKIPKKSASQKKSLFSNSEKTIEPQTHEESCDGIKKEVDDSNDNQNDVDEFPTGNVSKISLSLFSERKNKSSADQRSKSFFSSSAKDIELQTCKLYDRIKKEVNDDNGADKFPKSTLPKTPKRIYKPRPKKLCEICDKVFADSSSFAKHKRIHSDQKPFKCDQCHKSFRQSNDLKRHIRTHENNLEFSCDQCLSRFNCPFNLKRHKVVHAQEKPFQCHLCSSSFTRLSELKTHTMIHTQKDLFKCQLCDMTFSRASNLKRHISKHIFKDESYS